MIWNCAKQRWLFLPFVCLVLLLACPRGYAADNVEWKVGTMGVFSVPAEWKAVNILAVATDLETALKKAEAPRASKKYDLAAMGPFLSRMNIYQIQMQDNTAYRTAYLGFYKVPAKTRGLDSSLLNEKLSRDERKKLETEVAEFYAEAKRALVIGRPVPQLEGITMKIDLLGLTPIEYFTINKKQAYGLGSRMVISLNGLAMPHYMKGYIFAAGDSIGFAFLVTGDSDRRYWEPLVKKMIRTFKPA